MISHRRFAVAFLHISMKEKKDDIFEKRKDTIYQLICDKSYVPMKEREMAYLLEIPRKRQGDLSDVLFALLSEGRIVKNAEGCYEKQKESGDYLEGIFSGNANGYGFVTVEGFDEDFFVPEKYTLNAFHGDTVRISRLYRRKEGSRRAEARVVGIISHAVTQLVGTYEKSESFGFVVPDDRHLTNDIFIQQIDAMGAVDGHKVVCKLTDYGSVNKGPEGVIVEILGHKNDPGVDILSIIKGSGIPTEFPEEVLGEATKVAKAVSKVQMRGRLDLRGEQMVTIDGADSKDLDDAVSLHMDEDGNFILGVHIADVSQYVKEGSALDEEAFRRSTSVYLLDRVIPMLPHALSNGICSLNQGEDRLALSCIMTFSPEGRQLDYEIAESVVNIDRRMTYTAVNKIIEDSDPETMLEYADFLPMFYLMHELSGILRNKRKSRGALDFDFPEPVIQLDKEGRPEEIHPYERGTSQKIIEDFMLAANETVARYAYEKELPFLYRTHGFPDAEKLKSLRTFIGNFGYTLHGDLNQIHPRKLQELLQAVSGTKEESLIQILVLRSMQRAKYDVECSGHFGIAAGYYCHFTSPIRRYPDLIIHRILKENLKKKLTKKRKEHYRTMLPKTAKQTSEYERRADEAEREVVKLKKVEFMQQFVGEEFDGKISGVTAFGLFVELPSTVEGLIPVRTLRGDHFRFVEESYQMVGERTGKTFSLGDPVHILVEQVDVLSKTVDFSLVTEEGRASSKKKESRGRGKIKGGRFRGKVRGKRYGKKWAKTHRK